MSAGDWTSTGRTAGGEAIDFKSQWLRNVTDAAIAHQRNQQKNSSPPRQAAELDGIVRIRNESGDDRDRFDILGISGVVIQPGDNATQFLNNWMLKGVVPTVANHTGKFVICAQPIAKNQIGWAYLFGACPAPTDTLAVAGDTFDVTDSDCTQLTKTTGGLVTALYGGSDGDGNNWAIVRFDGSGKSQFARLTASNGNTGIYNGSLLGGQCNGSTGGVISGLTAGTDILVYNGVEMMSPSPTGFSYIDVGGAYQPVVPVTYIGKDSVGGTNTPIYLMSGVSVTCSSNGSSGTTTGGG